MLEDSFNRESKHKRRICVRHIKPYDIMHTGDELYNLGDI